MGDIARELKKNEKRVEAMCLDCADIIRKKMKIGRQKKVDCLLIYVESAVSNLIMEDSALGKLIAQLEETEDEKILPMMRENGFGIADTAEFLNLAEGMSSMLAGNALLLIDGYERAVKIGTKGYPGLGVSKAEAEKVMRGSNEAFTESEKTNSALIRKRIRDTRLKVKEKPVGQHSHTMTALVYLEDLVYPEMVQKMEHELESFEIDGVMDSGVIEQVTKETWYSPFPQYQMTERPDNAALAILEGRIVVLSDNSPQALIFPTTYHSFFQTPDDYFRHFFLVTFLRLLRYAAAFLAISLPGLYIAVTNFHTQILPTNLILSLSMAREGVPFPGVVEVILLELSFELLREAGVRMPGQIGNTIGIVGGLIIGQAAVTANLVSPMVVIVVAMTALSSFSIPNEEMAEACRLIKYGVILSSSFFGIAGFVFAWFLLLSHLARLKSFGIPYLMPFVSDEINFMAGWKDSIVKFPTWMMKRRPIFARRQERIRFRWKEK
ncbi:MAG: spore germination protein [Lachnospiraceae bacterium]|nr:spore germination protein [Robinsoniella sp.]MDY3766956.1 spore germination protein [Lachnospiraceae bacterium]